MSDNTDFLQSVHRLIQYTGTNRRTEQVLLQTFTEVMEELQGLTSTSASIRCKQVWSCRQILSARTNNTNTSMSMSKDLDTTMEESEDSLHYVAPKDLLKALMYGMKYGIVDTSHDDDDDDISSSSNSNHDHPNSEVIEEEEEVDFNTPIAHTTLRIQILSATIYVTLLSLPGSTASGMVQMDALHTLTKILNSNTATSCNTGSNGSMNQKRVNKQQQMVTLHHDLAEYMLSLPTQSFTEWSLHALEVYLDALVKCMCLRGSGDHSKNINTSGVICEPIVDLVMQEEVDSEENRQQTLLLYAVRVLHPMLGKSYTLPVPKMSRSECTQAASATLIELTRLLSEQEENRLASQPEASTISTVSTTTTSEQSSKTTDMNTPVRTVQFHQTPKSTGRRRSCEGKASVTSPKIAVPTPSRRSALKARTRYTPAQKGENEGDLAALKPRSQILSTLLGILHHLQLVNQQRTFQCDVSLKLLNSLPLHEARCFIIYLCKLVRCNKSKWRLFALEILSAALINIGDSSVVSEVLSDSNLKSDCLKYIIGRGCDKVPSIRMRAWSVLSQILPQTNCQNNSLHQNLSLRLQDTHASVRRAAVLCILHVDASNDLVSYLPRMILQDESVSVRKAAADVLTDFLFKIESDEKDDASNSSLPPLNIIKLWVKAIPSLLRDNEASVQAKAVKLVHRALLEYSYSWYVWSECGITSSFSNDLGVALVRYCNSSDANATLVQVLRAARAVVDDVSENEGFIEGIGAWHMLYTLLDAVSHNPSANNSTATTDVHLTRAQIRKVCAQAGMTSSWLIEHASKNDSETKYHTVARRVALHVLANSYNAVGDNTDAIRLYETLRTSVTSFNVALDDIRGVLRCLVVLSSEAVSPSNENVISSAYKAIQHVLTTSASSVVTKSRATYTLGEIALLHYNTSEENSSPPPQNLIAHLNSLTTSLDKELVLEAYISLAKCSLDDSKLAAKVIPQLVNLLQKTGSVTDANLASNAILLLSDLAIRYTSLVDRYVKVMAACLQYGMVPSTQESLQYNTDYNNVCVRVRNHAMLTLLGLLRADYIKPRKCVLYRMFTHLVKEHTPMRSALKDIICTKWPLLIGNSVVEVMMIYNGYLHATASTVDDDVYDNIDECTVLAKFLLPNDRMKVYRALIQTLNSEQRLQLSARIVREILQVCMQDINMFEDEDNIQCSGLGRALIDSSSPAYGVVEDALCLLMDPVLLASSKSSSKDAVDEDEDLEESMAPNDISTMTNVDASLNTSTMSANTVASHQHHIKALHSRLISKCTLRHVLDTTVPLLCQLKHTCETHKSPLLRHVMRYLMLVFQRWRTEARETLAVQPEVLAEIVYDLKRLQRERASVSANKALKKRNSLSGSSKKIQAVEKENENIGNMRQPDFSADT